MKNLTMSALLVIWLDTTNIALFVYVCKNLSCIVLMKRLA